MRLLILSLMTVFIIDCKGSDKNQKTKPSGEASPPASESTDQTKEDPSKEESDGGYGEFKDESDEACASLKDDEFASEMKCKDNKVTVCYREGDELSYGGANVDACPPSAESFKLTCGVSGVGAPFLDVGSPGNGWALRTEENCAKLKAELESDYAKMK
jgi:hypothetical protein